MNSKSLSKNAIFNVIYKLLNVLFPLLTYMYVGRILLPEGIGITSAAQNNVSYFIILATLGIPAYGIREIAKARNNSKDLSNLFSELLIINFILTGISILILTIFILFVPLFAANRFLYLIYGVSVLLNFINVDWLYQGLEEYVYIAIRSTILKIVSLLLIIVFVHNTSDIYVYSIITVIGISGNYIFNILHSRKYVSFSHKDIHPSRHIKSLAYLALCTISTELYARMDITMLDVLQDKAQVGLYSYAHRILNIVITFVVAVTAVFLPRLSYYYDIDKSQFNKLVKFGLNLMILLSIPVFVVLIFIAKPTIVFLFGSKFENASPILCILTPMIPLKCIGDIICYQVMMSARKEVTLMKSYFIIMVVNFINNLILIPRFGANGAALASVISEVLALIFVLFFSRKIADIKPDIRNLICTIIISILLGATAYSISILSITNILKILLSVIIGLAIFVIANVVMHNSFFIDFMFDVKKKILSK